MNKHLKFVFACLGVLALSGCSNYVSDTEENKIPGNEEYETDFFMLNRFNVNLHVGETHQISVLSIPSKYMGDKITFRSKDSSIAEVSDSGVVSAKSLGFTTIELVDNNKVVEKLNVAVSEDLTNEQVIDQCAHLYENMSDPEFELDQKVIAHEIAQETYLLDNNVYREVAYVEDLVFSIPDNYFKVQSQDISILTENGSVEHSSGAWEFFVDEYWMGYFFHTTATTRNYYEADLSGYIGKGRIQAIYDMLDMFFVDGAKIATDTLDDCRGIKDVNYTDPDSETDGFIPSCFEKDYSNVPAKYAGKSGADDLYASITLADNKVKTVTAEEEDVIDIESGTEYTDRQISDSYYHNNRVEGMYYYSEMDYQLNQKPAKRIFTREYSYNRDFEVEYPDFSTYQKVDQFYDL